MPEATRHPNPDREIRSPIATLNGLSPTSSFSFADKERIGLAPGETAAEIKASSEAGFQVSPALREGALQ